MAGKQSESAPLTEGQHLPATTEVWMGDDGTWVLTMFWQIVEGRPECVGIDLRSTGKPEQDPAKTLMPSVGAPLTTGVIRDLKLGELIRAHRAEIAKRLGGPSGVSGTAMRRATRERLEEAAKVYKAAFARGDRPTVAVAEHFGISSGGASNLVVRARAIGLLPPTSPGAPQG